VSLIGAASFGRNMGAKLYPREWANIGNGGLSDDEIISDLFKRQAEADATRAAEIAAENARRFVEIAEANARRLREYKATRYFEQYLSNIAVAGTSGLQSRFPLLLKSEEIPVLFVPGVTLIEPRVVRATSGGYGGSTVRLGKVSFRLGSLAARTHSEEELTKMDEGVLEITTSRLVFVSKLRTVNIEFRKLLQVDADESGIRVVREGRGPTEYFTWSAEVGREIEVPFDGAVFREPITGSVIRRILAEAIKNSTSAQKQPSHVQVGESGDSTSLQRLLH
jgi:hypothetical protein